MKASINGIKFGYEILGQGGVPVVLIHGFGLNRKIWIPMAAEYLCNHKVILPDLRGHGESDAPEGPSSMSTLAEDLVNLLAYLGIKQALVCGHSMGGYVTLAFASQYPQWLSGMGLITTRAEADTEEGRAGRYQMVEKVQKQGAAPLADSLAPHLTKNEDLVREMHAMLVEASPAGIISALEGMAARPDRSKLLPEIAVPALVVAGVQDQIIDLGDAKDMADALPDGSFLAIPDAGHLPMLESPEALGKGLLTLIHQVEALAG
jgi:3-oxoadipate enol-lactonase